MLGLFGLAKGALDGGGLLGGILQTGSELLSEIFKGGEQQQTDPFNAGSTSENAGLLNTCNCLNGGNATQNGAGANLKSFLDVAKKLLESLNSNENANGVDQAADKPADAQTAKLKELLEKLVQAFQKLSENQNANNAAAPENSAASANNAAQNNAAPANSAEPAASQAANQAENNATAENQDPLQQIVDLLKQLFTALTGKELDAENNAADANGAANGSANAPANNAAENAAQNPLQQIADLIKQLLDEIQNKQGAESADGNAVAGANGAEQANQAEQSAAANAPQQADGNQEPEAAKLENAVQQVLQLMQNLLHALQSSANNQQSAGGAQQLDSSVADRVRTQGSFNSNSFATIAASRFEAHMTARV